MNDDQYPETMPDPPATWPESARAEWHTIGKAWRLADTFGRAILYRIVSRLIRRTSAEQTPEQQAATARELGAPTHPIHPPISCPDACPFCLMERAHAGAGRFLVGAVLEMSRLIKQTGEIPRMAVGTADKIPTNNTAGEALTAEERAMLTAALRSAKKETIH